MSAFLQRRPIRLFFSIIFPNNSLLHQDVSQSSRWRTFRRDSCVSVHVHVFSFSFLLFGSLANWEDLFKDIYLTFPYLNKLSWQQLWIIHDDDWIAAVVVLGFLCFILFNSSPWSLGEFLRITMDIFLEMASCLSWNCNNGEGTTGRAFALMH